MSETKVLVFNLGPERYCVDIEHVSEIVGKSEVTPIPNSPPHIEGVMDLRGVTTRIIDPKKVLSASGESKGDKIVVFQRGDSDVVGWMVDEVYQVIDIPLEDVDESVENDSLRGIVKHEDGFILWVEPNTINN